MSQEFPRLHINDLDAVESLTRAQEMLIEKFEPVTGRKIELLNYKPGVKGVRIKATSTGRPVDFDPKGEIDIVRAELWISDPDGIPDIGADYTTTRQRAITNGNISTRTITEQSHRLLVVRSSGINMTGLMWTQTSNKTTREVSGRDPGHEFDKTEERKKETKQPVGKAAEIEVFLRKALQAISLR